MSGLTKSQREALRRTAPGADGEGEELRVRVPKAAELIAQRLRRQIVKGELREGDLLPPESALTETFGVSRPTLREAFRILEAESLLSVRRGAHGGARVNLPSTEMAARYLALVLEHRETTVADVYAAREMIEAEAVRLLARSRTKADLAALRRRHEELGEAVPAEPLRFAASSLGFHQLLVELTGNRTLAVLNSMGNRILVAAGKSHTEASLRPRSGRDFDIGEAQAEHAVLIELLEARDAGAAERHWRQHDQRFAKRALQQRGATTVLDLMDP